MSEKTYTVAGMTYDHRAHSVTQDRPDVGLHAGSTPPGTYRLWGEFRRADGHVLTVPFTADAY